jgi:hypothetical protein
VRDRSLRRAFTLLVLATLLFFASTPALAAGHSNRSRKPAPPPPPAPAAPAPPNETPTQCIARTKDALKVQENAATRLEMSSCEKGMGLLVEALRDAQKALKTALDAHDVTSMRAGRQAIDDLVPRIPHVSFAAPADATDLTVTFDDRPVPIDALSKKFAVNPGTHTAHAEGVVNAIPLTFDKEYEIKEGDQTTIAILMVPAKPEFLTQGQLTCMLAAKSQEEVVQCLPQNRKTLVVKAGFDMSAYSDTDHVHVLSPSVNGSVSSPTSGWNVGGSYLIDVVSAASPDIVSEASPPFHEVRQAGSLTGGYKPGLYGAQASANVSDEPDYLSLGGGLALTADLHDKLITPRIAYNLTHDTIGRSSTPFNVFHHTLDTNEIEAGSTFVMSSTSLLLLNGSVQLERGDQSKPYRYVPMFDPSVAGTVKPGQSIASVNQARLNVRPLEQLPTARNRYAFGLRFAHHFSSSTLRAEERIYYDSWQQVATTTDLRYVMDFGERLRLWPHARLNLQNAANFYKLAYSATVDPTSKQVTTPAFRTDDRELSPLVTITGGGGTHVALNGSQSSVKYGISLQADVMYTRFFDALFITSRLALYGTLGFDAEFE